MPHAITLYTSPSANGAKVQSALFETRLPHEVRWIDVDGGEARSPEYGAIVPLGQVPAITDPDGPGGGPLTLCESGAILIYLAEKSGRLLPEDPAARYEALQWVIWQAAGQGPVLGRLMWLVRGAGQDMTDRRVHEDFFGKARAHLEHLDRQLEGREFVLGAEYSVADLALWPWIRVLRNLIRVDEEVGLAGCANVLRWLETCLERPASKRATAVMREKVMSGRG